jgi:serine/threonine-protein phosphatase 2A regulatory subunit A
MQLSQHAQVLARLGPVVETLGSDEVDAALLPDVLRMAEDPQWRVRLSVVATLPVYGRILGVDLFNGRSESCVWWVNVCLFDDVSLCILCWVVFMCLFA